MQARWRAASEDERAAVGSRLARWPRWRCLYCTSLLAVAPEHLKRGVAVSSFTLSAGLARDYRGHEISRSLVIAAFVSKSLGSISTGGVMSGSFSASHRVWASQLHLSFKTRGQTL